MQYESHADDSAWCEKRKPCEFSGPSALSHCEMGVLREIQSRYSRGVEASAEQTRTVRAKRRVDVARDAAGVRLDCRRG